MSKDVQKKFVRKVRPRVVLALSNQSGNILVDAIVAQAREWDWDLLDYSLVYGEFPDDPAPTGAIIDALGDTPLAQQLHRQGCQVVRLGKLPNSFDRLLPAVLPDLEAAGVLAAQHFLERSFEHFAFVGHNPRNPLANGHFLYRGFSTTAAAHGAGFALFSTVRDHLPRESDAVRFERYQREIGAWLKGLPKPLGLLTYSDTMAARLCVICRRIGLDVPEQVAILGVGNTNWCERSPIELSSIMLHEKERARQAMLLLRDMMQGKPAPKNPIMIPARGICLRRSTDVMALNDLLVAKSLTFIWEHFREFISVSDIAEHVALSSRQLERRFRKAMGRSVNEEVVQCRLQHVQRLLRTTQDAVTDIAPQTGFRSARHLHHAFRGAFGITPIDYRNRARR